MRAAFHCGVESTPRWNTARPSYYRSEGDEHGRSAHAPQHSRALRQSELAESDYCPPDWH
eukprot:CAMPEP_0180801952 /NCGR_PEP_ID=MMETSP1038_2-20121128/59981_1 /TAXON_ID=632150 /ORGANISM="Azadinium spinosum, Strain 3D9" /LENGTH=59 /DNA_ID=CAMNT_0022841921 /DNA_START=1 /DNA_END=177 /DNA_ORIENTATION=-